MSRYVGNIVQETPGRYRCICPFPDHKDSIPSFVIMNGDGENWFKCFGCNRFGGPIKFLQEYHGEDNIQSVLEELKES